MKTSGIESEEEVISIGNNIEEIIRKNTADNNAGTQLSDSPETVIKMVDSFQLDTSIEETIISESSTLSPDSFETTEIVNQSVTEVIDSLSTTHASASDNETTEEKETTVDNSETETSTKTPEITGSGASETLLDNLKTANVSTTDEQIVIALLELEKLRGEQNDKKEEIKGKLKELETLLSLEEQNENGNNETVEDIVKRVNELLSGNKSQPGQQPRGGKIIGEGFLEEKSNKISTEINLFNNLQKQLFSLLNMRHKFLQDISYKINQELGIIKQTVTFLQKLVDFKLDQGDLVLGKMDPVLNILRSGSTSIFLMISRFFQAVESVLAMKDKFLRSFSSDPADIQETRLLERIKDLKLKVILPTKMRFLLNVHGNSDELGEMVEEIFTCVGELVDAKVDVIESVGEFVEQKIEYLSGLTGPGLSITTLLEAVRTGTLYKLANYGPVIQTGVPALSHQELVEAVEELLSGAEPSIPIIGPVKPLLVNHRVLGMLSGRYREDVINHYLARRLSQFIQQSTNTIIIRQGETILETWLPRIHLGTPCTSQVSLGRSWSRVVVNRRSRFSATTGPSIHSHTTPSLDMFGQARLHLNIHIQGQLSAKIGHQVWGKCLPKFSGDSPFEIQGNAVGTAFAKVIVKNV